MMHINSLYCKIAHQDSYRMFWLTLAMVVLLFLGAAECQAVTLTITATNGSVIATPDKTDYSVGEIVELRPKPDTGYYFTGWAGDAQGRRLVLTLTMDSNKAITANFSTWEPPIGIPEPEFGIHETHGMYDGQTYDFGSGPEPYKDAGNGPYTHYVDNTDPNSTDSSNPFGTVSKPRKSIPSNLSNGLPAGSVVEVHGGPYEHSVIIRAAGSADLPIFIRGVDIPEFRSGIYLVGQYMILEDFYLYDAGIDVRYPGESTDVFDHISIRNCEVEGNGTTIDSSGVYVGRQDSNHIVIYNNHIHHRGDYASPTENDRMGVTVSWNSHYIWLVDNHIHHNGGDSFQTGHEAEHTVSHVYVGRNEMHDDGENAVDIKDATDIIVSQNIMYNYPILNPSSIGIIAGTHESGTGGARRIWYIGNEMYNASDVAGAVNSISPKDVYFIGNIIHDVKVGLKGWRIENLGFVGNTIYNVDTGIYVYGSRSDNHNMVIIENNIFGNLSDPDGDHINMEYAVNLEDASISNNLFQEPMKANTGSEYSIEADPLFVDAANNNFSLQPESPAIDAGIASEVCQTFFDLYGINISKDFIGNSRPQGSAWDIGAYEYVLNAVTDLTVSGTSQISVTVIWTVPGEVGSSDRPGRYDIRYSTSSITEANWDTATQVQGEPIPGDFGDAQSFTITDLNPGTTYYVAIKTSNDTGSTTSPLSNVVSGTTTASGNHAPVLELVGDRSVEENKMLTFVVNATDADTGDTLTYSATDIPTGANFSSATQSFTWTPSSSQSGTYYVTFEVTDSHVTVSETITVTVTGVQSILTISSTNGGSTVPTEGTHSYDEGTSISIQATAVDNHHFEEWTGDLSGNTNPTTIIMDSDKSVGANFAIDQRTLTFSSTVGGAVTVPGEGDFQYDHGTFVAIRAVAESNYHFVNWTGTAVEAGKVINRNAAETSVTADADYTLVAHFDQQDGVAPTVTGRSPSADDIQVSLNNLIILHVTDAGIGVDASSVTITLDGDIIYEDDTERHDSLTGHCCRIGTPADFTYVYQPSENFDFDQTKAVTVNASDLGGLAMTEQSYSFTTEMRSFGQNKQVDPAVEGLDKAGPSTARDGSGNLWAVWHAGPVGSRDIYIAKLAAGADAFSASVPLVSHSADQANPVVAVGTDDRLYVAWQDSRQADGNVLGQWDIYLTTSLDGATWSVETRVNEPNENNQINPAIVVDSNAPNNNAYVVWQDDRTGHQDICIASSSDGFTTKTPSQIITSGTDSTDQTEPTISVDASNTVYVLWTDGRNPANGYDIYGAASNAGPWTNVSVVAKAADQSSPAIAAESAGSILHMLWVDQTLGDSGIYYASSNGLPGSPLTGGNLIDDYAKGKGQFSPAIAVTDSVGNGLQVFACWHDERDVLSAGDTDMWFVRADAGPGTNIFIGDGDTNSDQTEPAMGLDRYGHPYVVWTDDRGVNTEIYFAASTYMNPAVLASERVTPTSLDVTVGTDPANIAGVNDVSAELFAGVCPYDVDITITQIDNPPEYALRYFLNGYDFGPSGLTFNIPITMTIPYAVTDAAGTPTAYWYDSRTGTLSQDGITNIEVLTLDTNLHALQFKTTHLTPFFAMLTESTGGGGGGGGGGGCSLSHYREGSAVEYFLPYGILALVMIVLKWRDRRYKINSE